jgi:hypothetical protein
MWNDFPQVQVSYPTLPNTTIRYGSQPPQFDGQAPMILMGSRVDSSKGPAWVFVQFFNKVVILPQEALVSPYPVPTPKRSLLDRWLFNDNGIGEPTRLQERNLYSQWTDNHTAKAPDKPWFCFWNGTTLEGLVFVTQDADPDPDDPMPSPTAAAKSTAHSSSLTTIPPHPSPSSDIDPTPASQAKRQPPPSPSLYPKLVKITEHRNYKNAFPPYCQQMQILDNGLPAPLPDPMTGGSIIVNLTEAGTILPDPVQQNAAGPGIPPLVPTSTPYSEGRKRAHGKRDKTICQCQWTGGA